MNSDRHRSPIVLVIDDVEETRDLMEKMLRASNYDVNSARTEAEAVTKAHLNSPDLILITGGSNPGASALGQRIRDHAKLNGDVPVVVFCVPTVAEGTADDIGGNIYLARPDNFDQLRRLLTQLLAERHQVS